MSDLVFRTEELTNNQIAELYVASDYEQSIIDERNSDASGVF